MFRSTKGSDGKVTVTREASGFASKTSSKDGKITDHKTQSFSTGPQTVTTSLAALKVVSNFENSFILLQNV